MTVTVERGARAVGKQPHTGPRRPRPRTSYALFLLPGVLTFLVVVVVPFLMNTGVSFTEWSGVGSPKWSGLANYRELMDDSEFWASFRHSLFMVVAMAVVPTVVGLVLAAALFDYIGKHFGTKIAAVLRACFYLPQVLPIAVAGIVWSWILAPDNGALNALLKAIGLGSWQQDWLGDPDIALYSVMGVRCGCRSASRSSSSWRVSSASTRNCTRRPNWTARAGGAASGTSRCRRSGPRSRWC